MESTVSILIVYSVLIFLMSLSGGVVPLFLKLTHTGLQIWMSSIGGLMLGVGILHLLPHSFYATGSIDRTALCAVVGLLTMFSLIRIFHVHQHAPGEPVHEHCQHGLAPGHEHSHTHKSAPEATHDAPSAKRARLSWLGLMVGLSLHTLIDGVALASSVAVEAEHSRPGLWGMAAFLAILLHKPLDAMSIATVMKAGGWSPRHVHIVNFVFALMCPAGALAFATGVHQFAVDQQHVLGMALGFSAGVFLCISLSDLLPEVQFHSHDRLVLTVALFCGVIAAYLITFIEPKHMHDGQNHSHPHHDHGPHENGENHD